MDRESIYENLFSKMFYTVVKVSTHTIYEFYLELSKYNNTAKIDRKQ